MTAASMSPYPRWSYFPRNQRPPAWVHDLIAETGGLRDPLDSTVPPSDVDRRSDAVLARLAPSLEKLGFQVESGKKAAEKITRPVLYGDDGQVEVAYDIDAFHDEHGIALEVEAGRGAANGADYRDLVRTSLLLDARFLVLYMPISYHTKQGGKPTIMRAYDGSRRQLNAIYASRRLALPFEGVLLVGY